MTRKPHGYIVGAAKFILKWENMTKQNELEKAIEVAEDKGKAYGQRGQLYWQLKQNDKAKHIYTAIVSVAMRS